ncbi:class I tRNA ligase family protein, partial [bacterium]|nr:class I tRNA ligase family protein [bacterium]
ALWKAWDPGDGDVYWDTPLGRGRPGWHIECSAMSMKYLGETFDIHTGGEDNIFPHHENEIAQSEAATGKMFVKYWLHCAHLIVEGKKMSKSLGNFYTLRDLLEKGYNPMAIRYLLLATHYRQKLNFTFDGLAAAQSAIDRLEEYRDMLEEFSQKNAPGTDRKVRDAVDEGLKGFEEDMDDDLNISGALGSVFEMVRAVNRIASVDGISGADADYALDALNRINSVIAVLRERRRELPPEIEQLIKEREVARKRKDFATADQIRDKLAEMGIELKDTPEGTKWRWKK